MIDIVELKNADYLMFYVERVKDKTYIYCENIKTKERVIIQEI